MDETEIKCKYLLHSKLKILVKQEWAFKFQKLQPKEHLYIEWSSIINTCINMNAFGNDFTLNKNHKLLLVIRQHGKNVARFLSYQLHKFCVSFVKPNAPNLVLVRSSTNKILQKRSLWFYGPAFYIGKWSISSFETKKHKF